ncbi:MAG: hypothetical protein ACYC3I_22680 [Gemmataceae bacterium]
MNNSPLQKIDLANINKALQNLVEYSQHVSNAEYVGNDVEDHKRQVEHYTNLWNKYKQRYFPAGSK